MITKIVCLFNRYEFNFYSLGVVCLQRNGTRLEGEKQIAFKQPQELTKAPVKVNDRQRYRHVKNFT